jgi:hypothetical protein
MPLDFSHRRIVTSTGPGKTVIVSALALILASYLVPTPAQAQNPGRVLGPITAPLRMDVLDTVLKIARSYVKDGILEFQKAALQFREEFGEDANGELYALVTNTSADGTGGIVYKLAPVRLTIQVSGNLLNISWPAPGGRLQAQTNDLGSNWITVPGSATTNRVVVPIDPANGSVFYQLAVP